MRVFVAHTDEDRALAIAVAERLSAAGHSAIAGEQRYVGFREYSFGDPEVAKALRSADALVAISLDSSWYGKVTTEVAFFAGHSSADKTILVTSPDLVHRIPAYLESARRVIYQDDIGSTVEAVLAQLNGVKIDQSRSSKNVFLSYSRLDAGAARQLYETLTKEGYRVWFDETSLLPGQDWESEIRSAIKTCGAFVVLVSQNSIDRRGFFQRELRIALDAAEEVPHGQIFIIPVLLDFNCLDKLPSTIRKYHCVTLDGRLSRSLFRALDFALDSLDKWES